LIMTYAITDVDVYQYGEFETTPHPHKTII